MMVRNGGYHGSCSSLGLAVAKVMAMLTVLSIVSAEDASQVFEDANAPFMNSNSAIWQINWGFLPANPFNVTVGDMLQFSWPEGQLHDINVHPSGNCANTTDSYGLYPEASSGGAFNYTFVGQDGTPEGKDMFFACQMGSGVHCDYGVNLLVKVFSRMNTPAPTGPTARPTSPPTLSPTMSPAPSVSVSPTTKPPTTSPTVAPTRSPTLSPTKVPTVRPTASPTVATAPPTKNPTTSPTLKPTNLSSSSPTKNPTTSPTPKPSPEPTDQPTLTPTNAPSDAPTAPTTSPTTGIRSTTFKDLEMTVYGVSNMTEMDIWNWESATSLYQTEFFLLSGDYGVLEFQSVLEVVSSKRRGRWLQQENVTDDELIKEVTLTYNQVMQYRLNDPSMTESELVMEPFATAERRNQYVLDYLIKAGDGPDSIFLDVTDASAITGDALIIAPSAAPTTKQQGQGNPTTSAKPTTAAPAGTENQSREGKVNDGLSTGAIVGVVAGALFGCLLCSLCFFADRGVEEYDEEEEEENPYVPPSPGSLDAFIQEQPLKEQYSANNKSFEHVGVYEDYDEL